MEVKSPATAKGDDRQTTVHPTAGNKYDMDIEPGNVRRRSCLRASNARRSQIAGSNPNRLILR